MIWISFAVLTSFDGNSIQAAELLINNGFKEAYAIRGGVRGKDGWLVIQENLLPPPVHMFRKKKGRKSSTLEITEEAAQRVENGHVNPSTDSGSRMKLDCRSPYPNYPDTKPPSSPTPSKP